MGIERNKTMAKAAAAKKQKKFDVMITLTRRIEMTTELEIEADD